MTDITKITIAAVDQASEVFGRVQSSAERLQAAYAKLAGVLTAGVGAGYFVHLVTSAMEAAEQIDKLSQKTGISVQTLSQLDYVAKLNNLSTSDLAKGIKTLSQRMIEANDATSKASQLMRLLGVDIAGAPDKALEAIADKFAVLEDGVTKTALAVELFGKNGMAMIPMLNLGSEGIRRQREEAQALGLAYGPGFAAAASQFNDNMKAVKSSSEAFGLALANEVAPRLVTITNAMKEAAKEGGFLYAMWVGMGGVMKNIFSDEDLSEAQKAEKQIRSLTNAIQVYNTAGETSTARDLEIQLRTLKEVIAATNGAYGDSVSRLQQHNTAATMAAVSAKKLGDDLKNALAPGASAAAQSLNELNDVLSKIFGKEEGFAPDYAKNVTILTQALLTGQLAAVKYHLAIAALITQQPAYVAAIKNQIDAAKASNAEFDKALALQDEQDKMRERVAGNFREYVDQVKLETEMMGLSDSERRIAIELAKLEKAGYDTRDPSIRAYIASLREQYAAQESIRNQVSIWQQVGDAAGTFFNDILLHGKSAIQALRDLFKQLLAEMISIFAKRWVLQLAAAATGSTALGAAAGQVGQGTLAGAAGSWIGGASTALGGAYGASEGFAMGWASGVAGPTAGYAEVAGATLSGMYDGIAAVLADIPVYGWIALAVLAIAAYFSKQGGGPKGGGSFVGDFGPGGIVSTGTVPGSDNGRFYTPSQADAVVQQLSTATAAGYYAALARLGGTVSGPVGFGLGFDTDPQGTAQNRISSSVTVGGRQVFGSFNREVGRGDAELQAQLQLESQRALLAALQASTFPQEIADILNSVVADSATADDINRVLSAAQEMRNVMSALARMGVPGLDVHALEAMRRVGESLTQTFNNLTASLGNYYDLFYTSEEKHQMQLRQLTQDFAELGVAMPTTREGFRALVDGLDLTDTANAQLYRSLLDLASLFNTVFPAAVTATGDAVVATVNAFQEIAGTGFTFSGPGQTGGGGNPYNPGLIPYVGGGTQANLRDYMQSLLTGQLSPLDPMQQLATAKKQFEDLLALAQGGDDSAAAKLQGASGTYLQLARGAYASSSDYVAIFNQVMDQLGSVAGVTDWQHSLVSSLPDGSRMASQNDVRELERALRDYLGAVASSNSAEMGEQNAILQRIAEAQTESADRR